jgi:pyruvate/2-oxoglutarate dehydrogenase complex dihydrolipoamide dehydrogenase (E3) component
MTEGEARASGRSVLVGKRMMTQVGHAREFGETRGFMKIVVDADSKEMLGAALTGSQRGRGLSCTAGCDVREATLYDHFPRGAYPPYRV